MIPFFYMLYRFGRSVVIAFKEEEEFRALLTLLVILLATGTLFYHGVEGWGWLDSLYFCVITLTTVGYGDFAPHTAIGKVFTMIYLLVGIGVLLGFINLVTQHTLRDNQRGGFRPWRKKDESEASSS